MKIQLSVILIITAMLSGCANLGYDSLHSKQAQENREADPLSNPANQPKKQTYEEYKKEREEYLKEANKKRID